jgi:hypothetical protein
LITDRDTVAVKTVQGTIIVPSRSSVMLEQGLRGITRLDNLAGSTTTVALSSAGRPATTLTAGVGQEVIVAGTDTSDEEMIPTDGVERILVDAGIVASTQKVRKSKVNQEQLAESSKILLCNMELVQRSIKQRYDKLRQIKNLPAADKTTFKPPAAVNFGADARVKQYSPIAYVVPGANAVGGLVSLASSRAVARHIGNADVSFDGNGDLLVARGEVLVLTRQKTGVRVGSTTVSLDSGVIAMVASAGDVVTVRALWSSSESDVRVSVGDKHYVPVATGGELALGPNGDRVYQVLRADKCGRRRLVCTELGDHRAVLTSEISLQSLISGNQILRQLCQSSASNDKSLAWKIEKMSVAVPMATPSHGPYTKVSEQGANVSRR